MRYLEQVCSKVDSQRREQSLLRRFLHLSHLLPRDLDAYPMTCQKEKVHSAILSLFRLEKVSCALSLNVQVKVHCK